MTEDARSTDGAPDQDAVVAVEQPQSARQVTPLDADAIAEAVVSVAGVVGLHGGMFGEAATYLPGRRVSGVRDTPDGVEVHVSVEYGAPARQTAASVRSAVAPLVDGRSVHVTVEDVVRPGESAATSSSP